jgi:hypothetical protein
MRQRTGFSGPGSTAGDSASEAGSSGRELPPWNAPSRGTPSFNRLEQMARTIGELQSEVAHWKHASQVDSWLLLHPHTHASPLLLPGACMQPCQEIGTDLTFLEATRRCACRAPAWKSGG